METADTALYVVCHLVGFYNLGLPHAKTRNAYTVNPWKDIACCGCSFQIEQTFLTGALKECCMSHQKNASNQLLKNN